MLRRAALPVLAFPLVLVSALAVLYLGVTAWAGFHDFASPAAAIFRVFPLAEKLVASLFPALFHGVLLYAVLLYVGVRFGGREDVNKFAASWLRLWGLPCLAAYFLLMLGVHTIGASVSGDAAFTISGLLPYTDGADFLYDARLMELTGKWSYLGGQRPMAAGLRSFWLALSGTFQNYQLPQMLFCAFSLWLAAMAISRWRGTPAALVLCALCGPLAFIYLASPGTEANGLSAALLTLPLFIAALRTGSAVMAACAVAGTFLALTLRMGAFFIIPALFLWLFILFRKNRRPCVAALALSLFLVAAIAVSNFMLTRYYSPRGMSIGGNFSSTVCGMSVNGSWDTCDFLYAAELAALPSIAAHHKFLYAKTYENIQEQPLSFLKSMAWNGAAFLRHIWHHTTGSIVEESVPWPLLAPLLLALYFGCTGYLRSQKERGEILLYSAVFGGLFLSSLFIMRSEGFRAIAASYPLLWLMLSMGLAVPSEAGAAKEASGFSPLPSLFAIGFMFLASIGGPFIAKTNTPYYAPDYGQHPFENNEMAADLGLFGGVTVVADGTELPNNIPALYETVFLRKIAANYWGRGNELAAAMKQQLSPPYTVYAGAFQYRNGTLRPARSTYIVEGGEALPPGQARYFLKFEKFYQALYISYYRLMDEKLPSAD